MSGAGERHVLGLSGGKDSAALAVWMAAAGDWTETVAR